MFDLTEPSLADRELMAAEQEMDLDEWTAGWAERKARREAVESERQYQIKVRAMMDDLTRRERASAKYWAGYDASNPFDPRNMQQLDDSIREGW